MSDQLERAMETQDELRGVIARLKSELAEVRAERDVAKDGHKACHELTDYHCRQAGIDPEGLTHVGKLAHMVREIDRLRELEAETKNHDKATEISWCGKCQTGACDRCMERAAGIRDYRDYLSKVRQAGRLDKVEREAQQARRG